MRVIKRINNNVVLVSQGGVKMIVVGRGLGFKAYPGNLVNEDFVEQRFVLTDDDNEAYFVKLLRETSPKLLSLAKRIVDEAEVDLAHALPAKLVFPLADHIAFTLKRLQQGLAIDHPMAWEIRLLYPAEYRAGEHALELLRSATTLTVPDAEAAFFAMHFVNALGGLSSNYDAQDLAETMLGVVDVIERHFRQPVNQQTRAFSRFVVHLRYCLLSRLVPEEVPRERESAHEELYELVREAYPDAFACAQEVSDYLSAQNLGSSTKNDVLYLTLHINRLMAGQKEDSHEQ